MTKFAKFDFMKILITFISSYSVLSINMNNDKFYSGIAFITFYILFNLLGHVYRFRKNEVTATAIIEYILKSVLVIIFTKVVFISFYRDASGPIIVSLFSACAFHFLERPVINETIKMMRG